MPNSATYYQASFVPGTDLGNKTAETQLVNARGSIITVPLPSNGSLANKRFRLVSTGRIQTSINTTFTLNFYFGLSGTISSNTLIFSSGPQTINNVNTNYSMWLDMFWGSNQAIEGTGHGQMNNFPIGPAGMNNTVTADPNRDSSTSLATGATYGFTITGQFGNSSAGNHAIVNSFDLEEL